MRIQTFMFLAFVWVSTTMINRLCEAQFMTYADVEVIQQMTFYRVVDSQGLIGVPIMGVEFFRNLPHLLTFNYGFLTSGFAFMRFFLMCLSVGVAWGLAQTFIPPAFSAVGSLLRFFR